MSGAKAVLRLGGGFNVGAVLLRSRSAERRLRPPISKDNIVRGGTMREHLSDHTQLCNRTHIVAIFLLAIGQCASVSANRKKYPTNINNYSTGSRYDKNGSCFIILLAHGEHSCHHQARGAD